MKNAKMGYIFIYFRETQCLPYNYSIYVPAWSSLNQRKILQQWSSLTSWVYLRFLYLSAAKWVFYFDYLLVAVTLIYSFLHISNVK